MIRAFLLFITMAPCILGAEPYLFRERLDEARPGDYIVTFQNHAYTVLHVHDRSDTSLTFEEVTVPELGRDPKKLSWKDWLSAGAPSHSSWLFMQVDLKSGKLSGLYSLDKQAWLATGEGDAILSQLLNLPLTKIPLSIRRRMGPPVLDGRPDTRKVWKPRLSAEGEIIQEAEFDGWSGRWPEDEGPLSGRKITAYVPVQDDRYPSYLPYWVEIDGMVGRAHLRVIEGGRNMASPIERSIPKRGRE
jgi:hypothetical protein